MVLQSKMNKNPLHLAIEKGYINVVKLLIENGADVNSKSFSFQNWLHFIPSIIMLQFPMNKTPLHIAIEKGNIEIIKLLIENSADVNSKTIPF